MKVFVTDLAGNTHEVAPTPRWTVMEIIQDADLPILADCGGSCSCATCHVYVDPEWLERVGAQSEEERHTLDGGSDVRSNSRLSCQIVFTPELDGLRVSLSKDSAG